MRPATAANPNYERLLDLARSLPPEFAADGLLRVAPLAYPNNPRRRASVIREAFGLAWNAQDPYKTRLAPRAALDSLSGLHERAGRANLDRLSLQRRAIAALLTIDRRGAAELARAVRVPELHTGECDSPTPDVSAAYEIVSDVSKGVPTARDRQVLLDGPSRIIISPIQVGPIAKMLSAAVTNEELAYLTTVSFSQGLKICPRDPGAFFATLYETSRALEDLLRRCGTRGVPNTELVKAIREYYLRQINGERCPDSTAGGIDSVAADFNRFRLDLAFPHEASVPAIKQADYESKPSNSTSTPASVKLDVWQSEGAGQMMTAVRQLRFAEHSAPEWPGRVADFSAKLDNWSAGNEPLRIFVHEKCALYSTLMDQVGEQDRARLARTMLDFLQSNFLSEYPQEWFMHVGKAFDVLRQARQEPAPFRFRDPVVSFYWELSKLKLLGAAQSCHFTRAYLFRLVSNSLRIRLYSSAQLLG